jgi:hypothetical protein
MSNCTKVKRQLIEIKLLLEPHKSNNFFEHNANTSVFSEKKRIEKSLSTVTKKRNDFPRKKVAKEMAFQRVCSEYLAFLYLKNACQKKPRSNAQYKTHSNDAFRSFCWEEKNVLSYDAFKSSLQLTF